MFIDSMSRSRKFNQKLEDRDNAEELYDSYLEKRQYLAERAGEGSRGEEVEGEEEGVHSAAASALDADRRSAGRYDDVSEFDRGAGIAKRYDSDYDKRFMDRRITGLGASLVLHLRVFFWRSLEVVLRAGTG